ncbi:MAG: hypothetical protein AB7U62_03065 [Pseudolabrys sp.]
MPTLAQVGAWLAAGAFKWGLIVAAGAALVYGIDQGGYNRAMRKCDAAALREQLKAKDADLKAANKTAAAAAAAAAESDARARESEERVNDYAEQLKSRPNGACALTDDDLRILRRRSGGAAR